MQMFLSRLPSPLGGMLLVTDAGQILRALDFADHEAHLHRGLREQHGGVELTGACVPTGIAKALARYFDGELSALEAVPTHTAGTDLKQRVWTSLRGIAAGTTTTYGRLARDLGLDDPRAAIDIGAAIAANPIALVVPCHRVIGSDGGLRGYAWGLHRKRWLLAHEMSVPPAPAVGETASFEF